MKGMAFAIVLCALLATPAWADEEEGRYQVFNPEVSFGFGTSGGRAAILIDTQTGRAWILGGDGNGGIGWGAIRYFPDPRDTRLSPEDQSR